MIPNHIYNFFFKKLQILILFFLSHTFLDSVTVCTEVITCVW